MKNSLTAIKHFLKTESFSGGLLALATVCALFLANSNLASEYFNLLQLKIGPLTVQHWVNDALMALFFFVVGLEIKKEISVGELSSLKKAAFPIAGALGGMIVPAIIYALLNPSGIAARGWGIPMATDIAFAMAVLSIFGNRISLSLKIFLLALAIVDDLGAVLVIAVFYTSQLNFSALMIAGAALFVVLALQRFKIRSYFIYTVLGAIAWIGLLLSGIHATIAGVALGLMTPLKFPKGENRHSFYSPLEELIHFLHPWVSLGIMPLFALTNAGISLQGIVLTEVISNSIFRGIFFGLFVGKPLGILLFTGMAVKMKLAALPTQTHWGHISAVGLLAGLGFTMSLFISGLALPPEFEVYSKSAILAGSVASAIVGVLVLSFLLKRR